MVQSQLATMQIGSPFKSLSDGKSSSLPSQKYATIHIIDGQSYGGTILDFVTAPNIISDSHKKSLEDTLETFQFIAFGKRSYTEHLEKRNRLIISDEDGTLREFVIYEAVKYQDSEGRKVQVFAHGSYLELKKATVLYPGEYTGTASQQVGKALEDTGWEVGIIEVPGTKKITRGKHMSPYEFLRNIAREFKGELSYRITHDGNKVTGRYVDIVQRIGLWQGREVEFGKDLMGIKRIEKQDIVTALLGLGPQDEDGNRHEVLIKDEEALQRWGRVDKFGKVHHLIEAYEIESERTDMTLAEAKQYTTTALNKRINEVVTYEGDIADLENVPGMQNKQVRFGDTIRIKDINFTPPLYLEARIYQQSRSIKFQGKKEVKLGDFIEYTEEQVTSEFERFKELIMKRLQNMIHSYIVASSGNAFINGEGSTTLTTHLFIGDKEVTEDPSYNLIWKLYDVYGDEIDSRTGNGITITANDMQGNVLVAEVEIYKNGNLISKNHETITAIYDGIDGESSHVYIRYAKTDTGTEMSEDPTDAKYIGIAVTEFPIPPVTKSLYTWTLIKGEDGQDGGQGIPGPPGENGDTTYTWVKYADTPESGMSEFADGKKYIGLAFGKTDSTPSTDYSDYEWSLMPQNIEIGAVNIIVEHSAVDGYIGTDGTINASSTDKVTDFIEIEPNSNYTFSRKDNQSGTTYLRIAWYTEDEVLISRGSYSGFERTEISPVNAKYLRVSYPDGSYPQVEKGDMRSDWRPSIEDIEADYHDLVVESEGRTGVIIDEISGEIIDVNERINEVGEEIDQVKIDYDAELVRIQDGIGITFTEIQDMIGELGEKQAVENNLIRKYINFESGNIILGDTASDFRVIITNEKISFMEASKEVAYISNNKLHITDAEIKESLTLGKFKFTPRDNGSLDFSKI